MEFLRLAEVFSKMEATESRLQITAELAALLGSAAPQEARHLIYLCQGIVAPEHTGIQLGVGDKLAQHAISKVSGATIREIEAAYRKSGDLGETAAGLFGKKSQGRLSSGTLTTEKAYSNFHRMATAGGGGSQDTKIGLLAELLASASPVEAKAIVRFVQGSLRLGAGEISVLDALALVWLANDAKKATECTIGEKTQGISIEPGSAGIESSKAEIWLSVKVDATLEALGKIKKETPVSLAGKGIKLKVGFESATESGKGIILRLGILAERRSRRETLERAFNLRSDLGLVGELVLSGRPHDASKLEPEVFSPIRPALAERLLTPAAIIEKLGPCSAEGKYDGLRLQIHKKGRDVRIYSRRQEPMTHMFPEIVAAVQSELKCDNAILEGEAIAFDENAGKFLPFQVTIQRKRKHGVGEMARELPLTLFTFELLYADGKDYTQLPYAQRREALSSLIANGAATIRLSQSIIARDSAALQRFFDKCVSDGLEGIIAKDIAAPYAAGARKFSWIKLKKSYGKAADTFDLVIIGYYLGKGKRTQFEFGGLLCAAYDSAGGRFRSIAKVGTGFSEQEMGEFRDMLEKITVKEKPSDVESGIDADVWVKPQIVIEVNADEISKSPVHACCREGPNGEGLALRFPRMVSVRKDKGPRQATTEDEVLEMYEMQGQR
ncbi:MAG: ATP-dependent DNA ligase [Candidatus Micrarchaeota archaeon]